MSGPGSQTDFDVAAYRAELRTIGRTPRLAGFGLVLIGAVLTWGAAKAGAYAGLVQTTGYVALGAGWAFMLAAIYLRTRYHRRRLRELN